MCKAKIICGIAYPAEKLEFHTEFFEFCEKGILKIGLFHRVKELSKSNQTRCGVHQCNESVKQKKLVYLARKKS